MPGFADNYDWPTHLTLPLTKEATEPFLTCYFCAGGRTDMTTSFRLNGSRRTIALHAECVKSINESSKQLAEKMFVEAKAVTVILNGKATILADLELTYECVCRLAGLDPDTNPTVVWSIRTDTITSGSLYRGSKPIRPVTGMVIDAIHTGNA